MSLLSVFHQWKEFFRFKSLKPEARSIVFYATDAGSWRHFEPIISELVGTQGQQICYVTSSAYDPVLHNEDSSIQTFCIGLGSARTMWFLTLQAGVLVTSMPDLGTFHIKRSRHQVHYIYVHHSIVSTHMIYRQGAFDNFDSILCVGPHHKEEIRATEDLYSLKPKILVKVGYGNLDSILLSTDSPDDSAEGNTTVAAEGKRILIAPSWGENGLLESHGAELAEVLLGAGHHVIVRPHMMTIRQRPKLLNSLRERFASYPEFHLELGLSFQGTVGQADIMISDWSGAALEFAFGLERPVIFIDVPRKINNPDYQKIPCVPVEVMLRSDLGEVVSPDRLSDVPAIVDRLCQNPGLWQDRIRELRSRWIYNIRTSGKVAADYIAETAENAQTA